MTSELKEELPYELMTHTGVLFSAQTATNSYCPQRKICAAEQRKAEGCRAEVFATWRAEVFRPLCRLRAVVCGFGGKDGETPAEGFLEPRAPRFIGINRVLKISRRRAGDTLPRLVHFCPQCGQFPGLLSGDTFGV